MAGGHGVLDDWCGFLDGALAYRKNAATGIKLIPARHQPAKLLSVF